MGVASPACPGLAYTIHPSQGGWGKLWPPRDAKVEFAAYRLRREVSPDAFRGRSPCTREGQKPDRPETQWTVVSDKGTVIATIDLGYE